MNPEIGKLFEKIAVIDEKLEQKKPRLNLYERLDLINAKYLIKYNINEISATLNPQIPEPYASMSRDEILGGIGQYDTRTILGENRQLL